MSDLQLSLAEASNGTFKSYSFECLFTHALHSIWSPRSRVPPLPQRVIEQSPDLEVLPTHRPGLVGPSVEYEIFHDDAEYPELEPTAWTIAFTPTFCKTVAGMDKKLQGRVLVAITALSEAPVTVHGDTIKPLSGELKGLWRYRMGDYRLVYQPLQERRLVILLEFRSRGGVYEA